ncbi:hypothetical protein HKX48_000718, partial [Thoreauomyces humboldtii]
HPLQLVDVVVAFSGTSTGVVDEVNLIDCMSSVLPEDHDNLLTPGEHEFEFLVELPLDPPLPPSRKVVSSLAYHRKIHRIKYRVMATMGWHGKIGKVHKEIAVPIEPFLVYPGHTGELAALVVRPVPFRWDAITSTVQYDVAVSNTVLGPGDSFDLQFRVVPRGYVCDNVRLKLNEFCDDVAVLPSNGSGVHNGAGKRRLLSWEWKTLETSNLDDFFHVQSHHLTLPAQPRPNPSTLPSEVTPTAAIRHQLEIVIHFDGAPPVRLECPIHIISVPREEARTALAHAIAELDDRSESQQQFPTMVRSIEAKAAAAAAAHPGLTTAGPLSSSPANDSTMRARPRTSSREPSSSQPQPPPHPETRSSSTLEPLPSTSLTAGGTVRKATTIKKRDTTNTITGGGGSGGGAMRSPTGGSASPFTIGQPPPHQQQQQQQPTPPSVTLSDLAAMQDTLLRAAASNTDLLIGRLSAMEVEQKRLLRRVFELEGIVRNMFNAVSSSSNNNGNGSHSHAGYELENESTVNSVSSLASSVLGHRYGSGGDVYRNGGGGHRDSDLASLAGSTTTTKSKGLRGLFRK